MSAAASSSVIGSSEIADHTSRPARSSSACRNGFAGRLLAAEAQQRQHGGRARRPQQLLEQHGAVRVGPLQVVDPDDQRPASSPAGAAARAAPRMPAAADRADRRSRAPDRRRALAIASHLQQHREHPRQRRHIGRQQPLDLLAWKRREIAAQVVDDAVERLVTARTRSRSSGRRARRRRRASPNWPRKRRTSALLPMPDGP